MSRLAGLLQECPIAVTSTGAVSSAGLGAGLLCDSVFRGESTARLLPDGETLGCKVEIVLPPLAAPLHRCSRVSHLAALAAREALESACLDPDARVGLSIGTSRGPVDAIARSIRRDGRARASDTVSTSLSSLSGGLAQWLGLQGPCATLSTACTSGAMAIIWAAEQILLGKAGAMLAGGADFPLHESTLRQLAAAGILSKNASLPCAPFSRQRCGLLPGEGAGFLLLEPLEQAKRRGATPLALLTGWAGLVESAGRSGTTSDGKGLASCIEEALRTQASRPDGLWHVNTHGTGTRQNDLSEARALHQALSARTFIPSATKPMTGHCMGASPAMEAITCCHGLRQSMIPGSPFSNPSDPACGLDFPQRSTQVPHALALSTSSGFWGHHACLIFEAR